MRQIISAAQLPTLTALHREGGLSAGHAVPEAYAHYTASRALNDRVSFWRGDITALEIDAVVNAANRYLMGGGGVDGAIHRAAGRELSAACARLGGCDTGDAKMTPGFQLPAKKIIHAVGPVYHELGQQEARRLLASCYTRSLQLAVANDCRSIAFCGISTGIYGYPSTPAAYVASSTVRDFLAGPDGHKIQRVVFVAFDRKDVEAYQQALAVVFPPAPDDEADAAADAGAEGTKDSATHKGTETEEPEDKAEPAAEPDNKDAAKPEAAAAAESQGQARPDTDA